MSVLRGVGVGAAVLVAATNPYFGLRLAKSISRYYRYKKWRDFSQAIHYLDERGYVEVLARDKTGRLKVKITEYGKSIIKDFEISEMKLDRSGPWDGKWRIVMFDVPIQLNNSRLAFTEKLKELGFMMVQKSVWVCPYKCEEQIRVLRKFYGIEQFVTLIVADDVEDQYQWQLKFNKISLSNQL